MAVVLFMEPRTAPLTWVEFCDKTPFFSIALDGYVKNGPRFDEDGLHLNLNHHEEVDRLATRATCGQALMMVRQGLFERFRDADGPRANVYVNDCDEDVCVSWFLLSRSHLAESTMNPALNRLVGVEEALDATAGAYPFPKDLPVLGELAWIFEPYRRFRLSGGLDRAIEEEFRGVITDVELRIMQYITGRGKSIPLDLRYEKIGGGRRWTMVREIGAQARTGIFADGTRAYVAVRERSDGRWAYTIGRMSILIPYDVPRILNLLDRAERLDVASIPKDLSAILEMLLRTPTDGDNHWGGGNTIGGSPRAMGSKLPPNIVALIIEASMLR